MLTRFRYLLALSVALFGNWPGILLANVPDQPLPASPPSSFLLVASRTMTSPWFRESVILVTRKGKRGPTGIIVNRPGDITLDKIYPEYPAAKDFRLFAGGPVNPGQFSYLFRGKENLTGTLEVAEHIYLAYRRSLLDDLLSGSRTHTGLRVVNGLAGWMPGQLEDEIARGYWYILPIDDKILFDHPAGEMWPELFRRATTVSH